LISAAVASAESPTPYVLNDAPAQNAVRRIEPAAVQPAVQSSAGAPVTTPAPASAVNTDAAPMVAMEEVGGYPVGGHPLTPYGSFDFLVFGIRRGPTPPLVQVVSPEAAITGIDTGRLPPGSVIDVFSQFGTDPGSFAGIKAMAGVWLDSSATWGVEVGYNQLFRRSERFAFASAGIPVLGRAFFDTATEEPTFLYLSTPDGLQRGYITINAPTQMTGGDVNVRYNGLAIFADRTDYLAGFRYMNLRESIGIQSGTAFFAPTPFGLIQTLAYDSTETFKAENEFYGAQIGSESHFRSGRWSLDVGGKLAMGSVRQNVNISAATIVTTPNLPPQVFPNQGLLLVQLTNAGTYRRDFFAVLPEFFVRAGVQLTPRARAMIGYNLWGLSNVIRAGATIDPVVNPNLSPFITASAPSNQLRPRFQFNGAEFWAQGLTLGFAFDY
jgi:hypothetical protein